jgi:HEAT repeat protein
VREQFTRADGLCANLVTSGAKAGGKFYFASGWGWSGGGLMVFDPRTDTFTSWHRTDGLDADKLERVETDGARLKVTFRIERFHSGDIDYLRAPPGWFDPASGAFTSGGEGQKLSGSDADRANRPKDNREPLPFLGGWVTEKSERDGTTYWCGTRGIVIARGAVEAPKFAGLDTRLVTDPAKDWLAEAKRARVPNAVPLGQLKEFLASTNGFLRARALAAAMQPMSQRQAGYAAVAGGAITDSVMRVRATAAWLLSRTDDETALAPLRVALNDSDRYIRAVAALALARRGERPPLKHFEEILAESYSSGNYPFGADSSAGVALDKARVYEVLAPTADRETFRLLLKHPLESYHYDERTNVFAPLGAALRRQPDIAGELLTAYDENRGASGPVRLVELFFQHAGSELLPELHRALTNDDRVIRSNAARGCGAIGDPSSVPHLLKALDLESGLSRASIVWALGQLKATEALPRLIDLYTDARNDDQRRAGAGFRYSQSASVASAQFDSLRSVDAIASDWDELRAAAAPKPRDPRRNEELIESRHILEAVRKIGPAAAQQFYRGLAGAKGMEERNEAAGALADCKPEDRSTNVVILRNLLGDSLSPVRTRAAVSLLLLGETDTQPALRDKLSDTDNGERGAVLEQLGRLSAAQLEFARTEIEGIASEATAPRFLKDRAATLLKKLKRPE